MQVAIFRMPEDDSVGVLMLAKHLLECKDRIGKTRKREGDVFEDRRFAPCSHGRDGRIHPFAQLPQIGLFFFVLSKGDRTQGLEVGLAAGAEVFELVR